MKRHFLYIIAAAMHLTAAITSCKKGEEEQDTITMSIKLSDVSFSLAGYGSITIDWMDGTEIETHSCN